MHCFLCGYINDDLESYMIHLPIFFNVSSMAVGRYDYPCKVTLKDISKVDHNHMPTKKQQSKNNVYKSWDLLYFS